MKHHLRVILGVSRKAARATSTFFKDERGQSTTEYILILAVVVMLSMKFKTMFTSSLGSAITNVGTSIDQATSGN